MIIPVRCFTCNSVIADKWNPYIELVKKEKSKSKQEVTSDLDLDYIDVDSGKKVEKSIEGEVLDKIGLTKQCCRRHMLTHVDIF